MKISVIVPAFNEEKLLAGALEHIKTAMKRFDQFVWAAELIVCDNNSTDRTGEVARNLGAKVVFEPVNQISRARNCGAAAATGDWLIFVDADSYPSPELFEDVAEQIRGGKCLGGGVTVKMDHIHYTVNLAVHFWNGLSRMNKWMAGSFVFCETNAFRQLGGFSLDLFISEEIEFSQRLRPLAKQRQQTVVILHRHPLVTSARKLSLYSRWDYVRVLIQAVLRSGRNFKDREACAPWYDGRR